MWFLIADKFISNIRIIQVSETGVLNRDKQWCVIKNHRKDLPEKKCQNHPLPPFAMPKRQGVFCWEVFPIVKINYKQIVVAQECAGAFLFSHCFFPSLCVASLHRGEPSHFVFVCLMLFLQLSLYFVPIAQRASPPQGGTISFCCFCCCCCCRFVVVAIVVVANDFPEDLVSCKISYGGSGVLQISNYH